MQLLITGVNGFVGEHLVRVLSPHHTIYALSTSSSQVKGVKRVYSWDNLHSLPQVDAIIHLAAISHDVDGKHSQQQYFDVNYRLTCRIYDYFCSSSAVMFIYFSSVKAVADSVKGILTESDTPSPVGHYGISKLAAEQYISAATPPHKWVYILRPSMIYGQGCKGNLPLLCRAVKRQLPFPLAAFDNNRTLTSINNVTFVVERLLDEKIASGVYNVCDDTPVSTPTLISLIASSLPAKLHLWHFNKAFVRRLARMGDFLKLPFNSRMLDKLTSDFVVSNEKIKKALCIEHMPHCLHHDICSYVEQLKLSHTT